MTISARALAILGRFPRHLGVDDEGKLFAAVVDALVRPLEVQTAQVAGVRRAHRLGHAAEHSDLLRLAALHGLRASDDELLAVRLSALAADGTDVGYDDRVELHRERIRATIAAHRGGNGTVAALLRAAANALDLDVAGIRQLADRFWHEARCRDRLGRFLEPPVADDLLYLEENPLRTAELVPVERKHAEKFLVRRAGFDPVATAVRVIGVEDRTVMPMVVQRDLGFGVAFAGAVPAGNELRFGLDGTVTLDGADVTTLAYTFHGAVFADPPASPTAPPHPGDFLFADEGATPTDRSARFVTSAPVTDAFDPAFAWPRAAGALACPVLAVGETRWAVFVRVAHYGAVLADASELAAIPVPLAGVFDASVWAWPAAPDAPSAKVGFVWREREPFSARVWLPGRFIDLDGGEPAVRERVRGILDRHRAAGVHVYVACIDGAVPWPDGAPQPS